MSSNVRKYIDLRADGSEGKVYYLGDLTCELNGVQYVSWKDWGGVIDEVGGRDESCRQHPGQELYTEI